MWKFITILGVILFTAGIILAGANQSPVQAQTLTPETDTCYACHESLYLNYDTGRYYCLCEAPMHCTYCHQGSLGTMDKDAAHAGMILHPQQSQAKICQNCHEGDCQEKLQMFASHAKIDLTEIAQSPCTTTVGTLAGVDIEPLKPEPVQPWKIILLSLILICTIVLIALGVRCYREDCLRKTFQKS